MMFALKIWVNNFEKSYTNTIEKHVNASVILIIIAGIIVSIINLLNEAEVEQPGSMAVWCSQTGQW